VTIKAPSWGFLRFRAPEESVACPIKSPDNGLLMKERGGLLAGGEGQDGGEAAAQHDRQVFSVWNKLDPVGERAQYLSRPAPRLIIAELVPTRLKTQVFPESLEGVWNSGHS
jgi:hypothetical protein